MALLKIMALTFNQLTGTQRDHHQQKELFETFILKREFEILELLDYNLNVPTSSDFESSLKSSTNTKISKISSPMKREFDSSNV